MIKPENIKLIIWDLDDTFWNGTFSEEGVIIPEQNRKFLLDTLDMGIIHSICSKNNFSEIKNKLKEENLWDCFVFSSIDWTAKGNRVKNIIETMKLRAENVIFIDDNVQNLEEVKHYCPAITTMHPQDIPILISSVENLEKKDPLHKRLKQYQQLEEKERERVQFSSNDEFLFSCNIRVEIKYDCLMQIERIHELIMRSNQLNYTKLRQSKEELIELINDDQVKSGYVLVNDKFGDYGLVGFFAIKEGAFIHYVFSCRTLGMKVEQYVYAQLGYPELTISGQVVSELNKVDSPRWINQSNLNENEALEQKESKKKILMKGPCDMSQMHAFFNVGDKGGVVTEFTYLNDEGVSIEGHNHTAQIVTALYSTQERKQEISSDLSFFDENMLNTRLEKDNFNIVVLSMLTDGNLGVYKRKSTGEYVAFGEKYYPVTLEENRTKYVNNEIFTSRVDFTDELIDEFCELYEFVDNIDFSITIDSLEKIHAKISPKCTLVLLLGVERPFPKASNPSYENRHLEHQQMNSLIRKWAESKTNVVLLSYGDYVVSDDDFLDTINHFTKKVYYEVAKKIISIANEDKQNQFVIKSRWTLLVATLKQKLKNIKSKLKGKK